MHYTLKKAPSLDWKTVLAARADNMTGKKNTDVITEAWSPK